MTGGGEQRGQTALSGLPGTGIPILRDLGSRAREIGARYGVPPADATIRSGPGASVAGDASARPTAGGGHRRC